MEQYEIVFLDEDSKTVLDKQVVNKGDKAEYKGKKPEKEPENQVRYVFVGWTNEEKLNSVQENLTLVAKYETEVIANSLEEAFYNATFEVAKNSDINATMQAGQKLVGQLKALEKESRKPEEIVNTILKEGKTELAPEKNLER